MCVVGLLGGSLGEVWVGRFWGFYGADGVEDAEVEGFGATG